MIDRCQLLLYSPPVIKTFRHKGLAEQFETGRTAKVMPAQQKRCLRILDVLHKATKLEDINLPGYKLHELNTKPVRHSIWVSEQWRITLEWRQDGIRAVDLEQYH